MTFLMPTTKALLMPVGIAGKVIIDGHPKNNIAVTIKNLDTGETITTYTRKAQSGEDGWFVCAVGGEDGHKVRAIVNYGGKTYTKEIIVDFDKTTQYINFTISTSQSGLSPSSPPSANFTWSPTTPKVNETVTFIDISTDPDGDIISTTWNISGQTLTGHEIEYTFKKSGNFTISLVVIDASGYIDVCQKTISISQPQQIFSQNETNNTNIPQKTNITLFIEVKDKNGNPLPNTKVEIYQNNTLVQTTYTNESGIAKIEVQSGSYKLKAFYGSQTKTKRMSFVNDGRVVFLFNPEEQPETESFNWWLVIIPIIIIMSIVILILRGRKPWWT